MQQQDEVRKRPVTVQLEPGEYHWCACGQSSKLPFCDGSHEGTMFKPVKFTVEKKETMYLCTCQATCKEPLCDGSHRGL